MLLADRADTALADRLAAELAQVESLFVQELVSELDCVNTLVTHIEQYRGKMLRPTLVLLAGMAAAEHQPMQHSHRVVATVVEMVHMATLVHDDVLDEAEVRRRGTTINQLRGNEAAVMLGDYLISHAYHLCSSLNQPHISRLIAETTNTVCEGELHQLANRNNWALDEATYFEIIRRKTASLCGVCCQLGVMLSTRDDAAAARLYTYGEKVGIAFQMVDDLLDLTGSEATVGKTLSRDLYKGKMTLPVIHLLQTTGGVQSPWLEAVRAIGEGTHQNGQSIDAVRQAVLEKGSVAYARAKAAELIAQAKAAVAGLPASPPRDLLLRMADAVLAREN